MTEMETYKAALFEQAANGSNPDALFERISDETCAQLADEILTDSELKAAILHGNCRGLVDTYLLSVAERD